MVDHLRTSEWVTLGYFAYLLIAGVAFRVDWRRLLVALATALLASGLIAILAVAAAVQPRFEVVGVLRDWLPGAYLLFGYWAAGQLYRGPDIPLESRLESIDGRLFAAIGPLVLRAPRALLEFVEFAYLLCYPLVPAGLAALYLVGQRAHADSFWTLVLVATFAAYGVIPIAGTRPPRALELDMWIEKRNLAVRRVNLRVLERGSIQVNTFPSGHAAASAAVALFMLTAGWIAIPFAVLAAGICIGAALGRYHYATDVVAGVLLAVIVYVAGGY